MAAFFLLAGCGASHVSLRYQPTGPGQGLDAARGVRLSVRADAAQARYAFIGKAINADSEYAPLDAGIFQEPPERQLKDALEAELRRAGVEVVQEPAPSDGFLSAQLLEAALYRRNGFEAAVTFRLRVEDPAGRLVGQRIVMGRSPAWRHKTDGKCFALAAPKAMSDAMRKIGPILDGEGWLEALRGHSEPPSETVAFPIQPGRPLPKIFLVPTEDLSDSGQHCGIPRGAPGADKALADEIARQGLALAAARSQADWVLRPTVRGHSCPKWEEWKLRLHLQVRSRAGEVLWEGDLDGVTSDYSGKKRGTTEAEEAVAKLALALRGESVPPLFSEQELARQEGAGGPSMLGLLGALSPMGSLSSLSSQGQGQGLLQKAQAAANIVESVHSASQAQADAALFAASVAVPAAYAGLEIALLPVNNLTNDLDGPLLVRAAIEQELARAGFRVRTVKKVDDLLREQAGITDGGQLPSKSPQDLAKLLQADALIYCDLEHFDYKNVGVYSSRTVEARLKLVSAESGQPLWEGSRKRFNPKAGLTKEAATRLLLTGYGTKLLEKASRHPLRPETEAVARELVKELAESGRGR